MLTMQDEFRKAGSTNPFVAMAKDLEHAVLHAWDEQFERIKGALAVRMADITPEDWIAGGSLRTQVQFPEEWQSDLAKTSEGVVGNVAAAHRRRWETRIGRNHTLFAEDGTMVGEIAICRKSSTVLVDGLKGQYKTFFSNNSDEFLQQLTFQPDGSAVLKGGTGHALDLTDSGGLVDATGRSFDVSNACFIDGDLMCTFEGFSHEGQLTQIVEKVKHGRRQLVYECVKKRFSGHTGKITGIACQEWNELRHVASCSKDGTIRIWDTNTAESAHVIHVEGVTEWVAIAYEYMDSVLVAASSTGLICMWDCTDYTLIHRLETSESIQNIHVSRKHLLGQRSVAIRTVNGKQMIIECDTGEKHSWPPSKQPLDVENGIWHLNSAGKRALNRLSEELRIAGFSLRYLKRGLVVTWEPRGSQPPSEA